MLIKNCSVFWVGIFLFFLSSCGKAYFPIELKTISRNERVKGQEDKIVKLIPLTSKAVISANKSPYKRFIVDAGDLKRPAKIIPADNALKEKLPPKIDPGPYILGSGDVVSLSQPVVGNNGTISLIARNIPISDDGFMNIYEIGRVKAEGLTQSMLEDVITKRLLKAGKKSQFELSIVSFNSKKIYVSGEGLTPTSIPYTNLPLYLEDLMANYGLKQIPGSDTKLTLLRGGNEYVFSVSNVINDSRNQYRLMEGDRFYISPLRYRKEGVVVVGETGAQRQLSINAMDRPTLSNTILGTSVLNTVTSDFSQLYVIRKKNKEFLAYHLDITNPARISLANSFEMRPDDIVFVAAQPLTLYSRALGQMLGSFQVTAEARDSLLAEVR